MHDKDFPLRFDDFLLATSRILALSGFRAEVSLVAASPGPELFLADYDNWDGGQYGWRLNLSLPMSSFSVLTQPDRETMQERIRTAMNDVLRPWDNHGISEIRIIMEIEKAGADWRESAKRWADGKGLSNQGRVRSANIAPFECDGLLFRSRPEINLYLAFKGLGLTVAPLPVFIRGGQEYQRIEPDFILIYANTMMVVEVDGEEFHPESPVEAHERLRVLSREGVRTERVRASSCDTLDKARICAERILEEIKRQSTMR